MRRRYSILIGIILVVMLLLPTPFTQEIRSQVKSFIVVIMRPLYRGSNGVRKLTLTIRGLRSLPKENEYLSGEVSRLLVENSRLKEVDHENTLLRDELKFSQGNTERHLVAARIVARSAFSFQDLITIDRGSQDGLSVGQAVTSSGALVGKIIGVGSHAADVQLITSSDAITQAQLQNSRATGIVKGGIRGLTIENISQDVPMAEGELIVTSGLGGALRQGMLVGSITQIISRKNDIFQAATLKAAVNINRLDIVFVEVPL